MSVWQLVSCFMRPFVNVVNETGLPRARKALYDLRSRRKKTEKLFAAIDNACVYSAAPKMLAR